MEYLTFIRSCRDLQTLHLHISTISPYSVFKIKLSCMEINHENLNYLIIIVLISFTGSIYIENIAIYRNLPGRYDLLNRSGLDKENKFTIFLSWYFKLKISFLCLSSLKTWLCLFSGFLVHCAITCMHKVQKDWDFFYFIGWGTLMLVSSIQNNVIIVF